jgi:hypothetical protein
MRNAILFGFTAIMLSAIVLSSGCGSSKSGGPSCGGATVDVAGEWTCSGGCGVDVAELWVNSQTETSVTGNIIICVGDGTCTAFCDATEGGNSETAFTGSVSGDCIHLTSTDGTWSASGSVNGNNMALTLTTNSSNCFGSGTKKVALGR